MKADEAGHLGLLYMAPESFGGVQYPQQLGSTNTL